MNTRERILSFLLVGLLVFGQGGAFALAVEDEPSAAAAGVDATLDGEGAEGSVTGGAASTTDPARNPADPTGDVATDPNNSADSANPEAGAEDPVVPDPAVAGDSADPDPADPADAGFYPLAEPLAASPDGVYTIVGTLPTGKLFDIAGASTDNGAKLQMYVANRTPAQRFRIKPVAGEPGYYTIVNIQSGKALDVPSANATSGVAIQQYSSNGTDAQKWAFASAGGTDGSCYIVSKLNPRLCLDVTGGSTANGARMQLYTANQTAAQKFLLKKQDEILPSGLYALQSKLSSTAVLDVAGGSLANGANAQIYQANSSFAQKFLVEFDANTGYYTITNSMSKKALDVASAGVAVGTNVNMYTPNKTNAQKWAIESDGKGAYVLYTACSGQTLDVQGASTKSATNVHTYPANGTLAQSWTFSAVNLLNDGLYLVKSALGTVLDVASNGTAVGTNVQSYRLNASLAQRFKVAHRSDAYYTIECLNSGLLVAGVAGSGNVQLGNTTVDDSKLWQPVASGDGYLFWKNKATGKVLDIKGASSVSGTNVQLYNGNSTAAQKWSLAAVSPLPDGFYSIVSALDSNLVIDITNASRENGAKPQLYPNNSTTAQRFDVNASSGGGYTIKAICSSKNLDVANAAIDAAGNGILQQYTPNGTTAQKWQVEYVGNGQFTVFSLIRSTSCITVQGTAATGASLVVGAHTGAASQRFVFKPVSDTVYVSYGITLDQMAAYQRAGNLYIANVSLAEIRSVLDPNQISGTASYQFADLRSYSGLSATQINAYLASTALGRSGILKNHGASFVAASQQYGINECFLVAHAVNETGWGTSQLAMGYYYDGKTAIEGISYPAGTYYNFFGIGAYDSSPLSGGRSMAIKNGWNTPEKAILGGTAWIATYYVYASSYPQPTAYDMKWDVARSNLTHSYSWHQYATDHMWSTKNSKLMSECYAFNGFTPKLQYLIPVYAS